MLSLALPDLRLPLDDERILAVSAAREPLAPGRPLTAVDPIDSYLRGVAAAALDLPREPLWQAVDLILEAGRAGRRIYLVGNGGSAATASHMANDLCKQATVSGQPLLRAIALTDNVPLLTAWSNDQDYAESFARQLANHLEPGDLLVAISTSGRSPNVLRALELARLSGARSIGLTGEDGGALRELVDCCITVPSGDIGQQEDLHLVVNHALTTAIRARLIEG